MGKKMKNATKFVVALGAASVAVLVAMTVFTLIDATFSQVS